ncbi:hypothetical protein VIOR3934_00040 [Vibrio orientalis CIP 102891 = ATCC 33934]|uniref:Uncharacterized protein n=1 Tax=Vibrio orientalis CIP 102891 = ATCC 33934 TaxID=675816 RepID=F9SSA7_VIBOR|nr:hypothetical protein VIOR3934_00040 [Vibrio orientalis CIP 102891 = ATCC 33934]
MTASYVANSLESLWDFVDSDYSKIVSGGHVHCLFSKCDFYPSDIWFISNKTRLTKITFTKSSGGFVRKNIEDFTWHDDLKLVE